MVALLAIAANFPENGGWTVIQCASNFSDSTPSTQHGPNLVMFLSGEVRIAHRAAPAWWLECRCWRTSPPTNQWRCASRLNPGYRSEEHTSELQSRGHLVCRVLLERKMFTILL